MTQLTTYTIKSKNSANVWVFKYHLNGTLALFEVLDGLLTEVQVNWLFKLGHFPYQEQQMREWQKNLKQNFEIVVGDPDLSFDTLWNAYDNKVKRQLAEKSFAKLKQADVIRCFQSLPGYNKYLARKNTAKAHLSTFINNAYYLDDWSRA
jgi:hypothetical protein